MSRLTKQITSVGGQAATALGPEGPGPATATGVVVDGVLYPLAGQPPVAVSRGWGDLSFLRWRRI